MTTLVATLRRRGGARPRTETRVGGAWLLSAATLASGVLTYAFQIVAARALGPSAYGQIAVLWAAMFLVSIVLFRPLEQTTSRTVADRLARGEEVRSVLRAVAALCTILVVAIAVAAVLSWSWITERLFLSSDLLAGLLLVGIASYGAQYLVRGLLGGTRWFGGYSLGLLADSVGRLLIAAPIVVVASQTLAATAVVAAGAAGALAPLIASRGRLAVLRTGLPADRFRLRSAAAFAAPASVIASADQVFVNGGPLLVAASGGRHASHAAGIVFAATMLVRAPVYVFQGVGAALLPSLTDLHAREQIVRFRSAVTRMVALMLFVGVLIVTVVAVLGPESMRGLYGPGFAAARSTLTVLGAAVGVYLVASTFSQALLALDSAGRAAAAWAASAALFCVLEAFVLPGDPLARVSWAFLIATLVCAALLGLLVTGRLRTR